MIGCHCEVPFSSRYAPGSRDEQPKVTSKYLRVIWMHIGGTEFMSREIDLLDDIPRCAVDTFLYSSRSGAVLVVNSVCEVKAIDSASKS